MKLVPVDLAISSSCSTKLVQTNQGNVSESMLIKLAALSLVISNHGLVLSYETRALSHFKQEAGSLVLLSCIVFVNPFISSK